MLIIDQWRTNGVTKTGKVHIEDIDTNSYALYIDDVKLAESNDYNLIKDLSIRLMRFLDMYKREIDTFDVSREIDFINTASKNPDYIKAMRSDKLDITKAYCTVMS
jgi:hypothetical protein